MSKCDMTHRLPKLKIRLCTRSVCRVPDIFSSLGVNTEFQRVNSHYFPQIITNFSISLSGHVGDFVGFLTRDPSLIWNTVYGAAYVYRELYGKAIDHKN